MLHRCQHIYGDGLQCVFYLHDDARSSFCPFHDTRTPLHASLALLRRLCRLGRCHTVVYATQLYLDPHARLSRGTLHPGSVLRMLALSASGWMQVEVIHAARLPVRAQGWVRQTAVR